MVLMQLPRDPRHVADKNHRARQAVEARAAQEEPRCRRADGN